MIIKMLIDYAGFEAGDVVQVDGGLLEMILEADAGEPTAETPWKDEPKPKPITPQKPKRK